MAALFRSRPLPAPPASFAVEYGDSVPVYELAPSFFTRFPHNPHRQDTTAHLALVATRQAMQQAGLSCADMTQAPLAGRVGVVIGTTVGCVMNDEPFYFAWKKGNKPDLHPVRRFLEGNAAACIVRELGCCGPAQTVTNACTSGADALLIGKEWIQSGLCDIVLAGGSDAMSRVTYYGFRSLLLADPAPCRPFDASRRGLNLGEGAGILVLESEASQKRRRVPCLGELAGAAAFSDGHHATAPSPEGVGLRKALHRAMQQADCQPTEIAFVNAHGTGTKSNDATEGLVMNTELPTVPVLSTKGFTGHTLGAAGALEAVLSLGCLSRGTIPASAGYTNPGPDTPAAIATEPTALTGDYALSFSLGFGGNNTVIALKKTLS